MVAPASELDISPVFVRFRCLGHVDAVMLHFFRVYCLLSLCFACFEYIFPNNPNPFPADFTIIFCDILVAGSSCNCRLFCERTGSGCRERLTLKAEPVRKEQSQLTFRFQGFGVSRFRILGFRGFRALGF